ncbi:odorant receptor 13a [Andrena cerasifolii]|uniref:odorant receptor 13a n=1 Tax=Andrena cerasifolii TaxID=2819439 RepID=UPI00403834D4
MTTAQIFQYWYLSTHFNFDNLANLVDSVSTTLPYSLLYFKLITFWRKRGLFKNILTTMATDWTYSSTGKLDTNTMISKADLSNRCSKLIMCVYTLAVFFYSSVFVEIIRESDNTEFDMKSREFLIKMEFPFASYNSPMYECILLVQFFQLMAIASAIGMLDALIITLIFHSGGQIEMMHQALAEISIKNEKRELPKETMKSLVDRHYKIINFSKDVENLFSYIALLQLLCNTLIICCIGFLIIISLDTDQNFKTIIRTLFFYAAITLEAFVFCFAGEYLSSKSTSINNAVYNSVWYLLQPNDSRGLLLLMVRSQKQLTITAGKFGDLSLEGFANMLKASVSYVSVLYAMY